MSDSSKKQTFLHGAALLAIATAVVKVIGALYKIPLKMVIGDQGYGYFMTAYDIYSVLLMISTAVRLWNTRKTNVTLVRRQAELLAIIACRRCSGNVLESILKR